MGYGARSAVDMAVAGAAVLSIGIAIAAVLTKAAENQSNEKDESINIYADVRGIVAKFDTKNLYENVMNTSAAGPEEIIYSFIQTLVAAK